MPLPHVVFQAFAGLLRIARIRNVDDSDPVEPEVAKILAQLAPRAQRPSVAPEVKPERPHAPLRGLAADVLVVEVGEAMLGDRVTQRVEPLARLWVDEEPRREKRSTLQRDTLVARQRCRDLGQGGARASREPRTAPRFDEARADDQRVDLIESEHEWREGARG